MDDSSNLLTIFRLQRAQPLFKPVLLLNRTKGQLEGVSLLCTKGGGERDKTKIRFSSETSPSETGHVMSCHVMGSS